MAKGGLSGIKLSQGNNVINDSTERKSDNVTTTPAKAAKAANVVEEKQHRLVIDIPEDLYWKFKTASGMRKQKMKESMIQALQDWIKNGIDE